MTQPAKVQEPSMEEILASIRRIIADDEAKPPVADKAPGPAAAAKPETPVAAPAVKAPVMNDIPPSSIPAARAAAAKAPAALVTPAPLPAKPAPAPAATNSQDDIDAMLAGLDEATSEAEIRPPQPDGEVFELTDEMAVTAPAGAVASRRSNLRTILNLPRPPRPGPRVDSPPSSRRRFKALRPRSPQQILSHSTVSAVEIRLQQPCQYRAEQQCPDAGRPGQGNDAADAEILARRQSAGAGRAHCQSGNRTGFARTLTKAAVFRPPGLVPAFIQPLRRALPDRQRPCHVDLAAAGGFLAHSHP